MKKIFTSLTALFIAVLFFSATALQAQTTLWEEDFTDSLDGWTTVGTSAGMPLWDWAPTGDGANGAYWGTGAPITSPTGSTGAAIFNSDFLDNGGVAGNFGGGAVPSPHTSELISPVIDLTGNPVTQLQFYHKMRNYDCNIYVSVSQDAGTTWSEAVEINASASTDGTEKILMPMINEGPVDQVQFKFIWDGDYYYWLVDDVSIVTPPATNLALGDFFYPASAYATPESQIGTDTMGFFAYLSNKGGMPQYDVTFKAEVLDAFGTVLFSDEMMLDTVGLDVQDSVFQLPNTYAPELGVGVYTVRYTVGNSNMDFDDSDNMMEQTFEVTPAIWSMEGDEGNTAYTPSGAPDYLVGNHYRTSNNWVENYVATTASFNCAKNAADGDFSTNSVTLYLVKILDSEVDQDWELFETADDLSTNTGLEIVGSAVHDFDASYQNFAMIDVPLEDFFSLEANVALEADTRYFLLADYNGPNSVIFHGFSDGPINYIGNVITTVTYSSQWFLGGFGPEVSAVMRMTIALASSTDDVALPESSMKIAPNPTSNLITVDFDLEETADVANLTIAELTGKVLKIDELFNIKNDSKVYDMSAYPSGTYLVRLATKQGTRTMKVVVQH